MKAAIPQLVPAEALTKACGFGQLIQSACAMGVPMLGALLMSAATMPLVMAVDVVGAALAVLALATVRLDGPPRKEGARPRILAETKEAFGALRSDKAPMRASLPVFATSIVFMLLGSLLPLMILEHFSGGAWHNGIVKALLRGDDAGSPRHRRYRRHECTVGAQQDPRRVRSEFRHNGRGGESAKAAPLGRLRHPTGAPAAEGAPVSHVQDVA